MDYQKIWGQAFRYAVLRGTPEEEAEEFAQEMLLLLFSGERVRFEWEYIDHRRKELGCNGYSRAEARNNTIYLEAPAEDGSNRFNYDIVGKGATQIKEVSEGKLRNEISKLQGRQREVVYLYFWGNYSHSEIARKYKLSESRISQIIKDALIKIKCNKILTTE